MKDSAYSGLYSEIAFIIGIAVIMIDTFFPPEETKAKLRMEDNTDSCIYSLYVFISLKK